MWHFFPPTLLLVPDLPVFGMIARDLTFPHSVPLALSLALIPSLSSLSLCLPLSVASELACHPSSSLPGSKYHPHLSHDKARNEFSLVVHPSYPPADLLVFDPVLTRQTPAPVIRTLFVPLFSFPRLVSILSLIVGPLDVFCSLGVVIVDPGNHPHHVVYRLTSRPLRLWTSTPARTSRVV